jgi:argininosuccinate synthase
VQVKLYKGTVTVAGRKSSHSLYDKKLATYTDEDTFDHSAGEGFIRLYGLAVKTYHQVKHKTPRRKKIKRMVPRLKKLMNKTKNE